MAISFFKGLIRPSTPRNDNLFIAFVLVNPNYLWQFLRISFNSYAPKLLHNREKNMGNNRSDNSGRHSTFFVS
jgi:hypothetical protein